MTILSNLTSQQQFHIKEIKVKFQISKSCYLALHEIWNQSYDLLQGKPPTEIHLSDDSTHQTVTIKTTQFLATSLPQVVMLFEDDSIIFSVTTINGKTKLFPVTLRELQIDYTPRDIPIQQDSTSSNYCRWSYRFL